MVTGILIMFILACLFSFFEDRLPRKYKVILYVFFGVVLLMIAGFREIGIDPDSDNYESTYRDFYHDKATDTVEVSYVIIASLLNMFSSDVHILFVFYALFGIGLKFLAIRKYTPYFFLPIVVYLSYYYELHELTQIRTGILSAMFLLAIKPAAEGKKWLAAIYLLIGTLFHTSGLILFPLLLLNNKEFNSSRKFIWSLIIPASYVFYMLFSGMIMVVDLPYIGNKLAMYQAANELGVLEVATNVFAPLQLFTSLIFYVLLYFSDTIQQENRYFPLMVKIFGIGICCYVMFAFLPVLAERTSYLLRVMSIILFVNICYIFKPRWVGILATEIIALVYLNYSLQPLGCVLLWKIGM